MDHPEILKFREERANAIKALRNDKELNDLSLQWMLEAEKYKYTYNFSWLGRPIIKYPADMIVQQELMWSLKPDLVIETGIAHGGSVVFTASMMELIGGAGEVVAVDLDIRDYNRELIEGHPMFKRITMYEGSSTDIEIIKKVKTHAEGKKSVIVILDSCHSHNHVLSELNAYSVLVTKGSYCILPDTFIEFFPTGFYAKDRPWDVGNNPYTAMKEFLSTNNDFEIDNMISAKALISETIDGYLKKVT